MKGGGRGHPPSRSRLPLLGDHMPVEVSCTCHRMGGGWNTGEDTDDRAVLDQEAVGLAGHEGGTGHHAARHRTR